MQNTSQIDWDIILDNIPPNANEATVSSKFIPSLFQGLGFGGGDECPQFNTGRGADCVDFAARRHKPGESSFLFSKTNPYLLVEVKGRATNAGARINLSCGTPAYRDTQAQIIRYLLAPNCVTAQWGIITNSTHIQLFRRHGKIVIPATANLLIKKENIHGIISHIKQLIDKPPRSLSICIYNNKGGVGKTTTVINLAAILRKEGKRVLVVDFDSQADSSQSLNVSSGEVTLSECLIDTKLDIRKAVVSFSVTDRNGKTAHLFDVIPCDNGMDRFINSEFHASIQRGIKRLRDLLNIFTYSYDYILIDCPTQWLFFSQSGVYASDVVLIPSKHNGLTSLHNAVRVIRDFIPEIQKERRDGGPVALPIFFNGERITEHSRRIAEEEIDKIVSQNDQLLPYFRPKATKGNKSTFIFHLPAYASVANAAFVNLPAVFVHKTVAEHYLGLAKEYFL
ncbi:MAG: hypothetical protein B0A82_03015 [Alkalinema sp. CACIAM 70d]|nr:MAG: hypothetical protein B0A82_03015 [Alkalinema sp. CACIAM 70d]